MCLFFLLTSGLQIFNAHPALYWGQQSDFAHPWLAMGATETGGQLHGVTWVGGAPFDTTGVLGASRENGMLVERGAYEANPLMAPLVMGSGLAFTGVKIGLTAAGVVLLTQLARLRAFGNIPVGVLLYMVLAVYGALIAYEFGLLRAI